MVVDASSTKLPSLAHQVPYFRYPVGGSVALLEAASPEGVVFHMACKALEWRRKLNVIYP